MEKLRREKLCFLKIDILSTLFSQREYDFLANCLMKVFELQVHSKKSNSLLKQWSYSKATKVSGMNMDFCMFEYIFIFTAAAGEIEQI